MIAWAGLEMLALGEGKDTPGTSLSASPRARWPLAARRP
jgi:hypothetical protein